MSAGMAGTSYGVLGDFIGQDLSVQIFVSWFLISWSVCVCHCWVSILSPSRINDLTGDFMWVSEREGGGGCGLQSVFKLGQES